MNRDHTAHVPAPQVEGGDPFANTAVVEPHTFANFGCERLKANPPTPEEMPADVTLTRQMFPNGLITFRDGVSLRMFGFEEPDPNNPVDPELQLVFNRPWRPAPMVRVRQGQVVHGILKSRHGSHTIHWHGIEPSPFNDGVGHTSFEVTGSYTYQWLAEKAGSYFYHCHVNTPLHFEMGMYGLLIVDPPTGPGTLWDGGPRYDIEAFWVVDDIDPRWHLLDKEAGLCGGDVGLNVWNPTYFIVNGIEAVPGTPITDPGVAIRAGVGQTVLIRHLNASYGRQLTRVLDPSGQPVPLRVMAVDARPCAGPYASPATVTEFSSITAQRHDVLFTPSVAGRYGGIVELRHWMTGTLVATVTIDISVGLSAPPSVVITTPAPAARVSGQVPVAATASDDGGIAGVQFKVDGQPLGAEITAPPYAVTWDTARTPNGNHEITAVARDTDGSITVSSAVPLFVFNTIGRPGVIASYGFNEGSGLTVHDGTGNGHNGSISGAKWAAGQGRFGHALSFDGNDTVVIGDTVGLQLGRALTLEAWVRPTTNTGALTVIAKDHGRALSYGLYAHRNPGGPVGVVRVACSTSTVVGGATDLPIDTWSHLALTYDGAALRIFINAVAAGELAISGAIETSGGAVRIGGNGAFGQYFSGLIDEVRLYNRALTAAEIQEDMNTPV